MGYAGVMTKMLVAQCSVRKAWICRIASAGVLVGAITGCASERQDSSGASTGRPQRASVVVVGDSITEGSRRQMEEALAFGGFTDIIIDAVSGRRIAVGDGTTAPLSGVTTLQNVLAIGADPDVWVLALGSNDVGKYPPAEYESLLNSMIDQIPADADLVWVDVYVEHDLEGTAQFNESVRTRLVDRNHSTVASWFQFASDPAAAVLQDDRLHPNEAGQQRFAALVTEAALVKS